MLQQIAGIVILDTDGARVVAKYTTGDHALHSKLLGTFEDQRTFEAQLKSKASRVPSRGEVEVIMTDTMVVLLKSVNDINIFLIGNQKENELILLEAINALYNALHYVTNGQVMKRQLQENLGSVFIILDELLDQGLIFETDSTVIVNRLQMSDRGGSDLQEQTAFNQALHNAKENLLRSFLASS